MGFEKYVFGAALAFATAICANCNYTEMSDHPCPPQGTTLTYENFGKSFLDGHCQGCHGTTGGDRKGAPTGIDFGDIESVHKWKVRIFDRSAATNTTMPPGPDDPPAEERAKLADWLACGAP
jgi:mono/diheme cytochrome c family protein